VAACKAFYYYLKHYCGSHVSWEGTQLSIPTTLPDVNEEVTSPSKIIYFQNVCTWSYTYTWWQWTDWRRHIDWIAMSGITLTLAPFQEDVWREVYLEMGLTNAEIDEHLSGPGFLAWSRMGNMRGWGGPMSENFMNFSSTLQKQVINALRDLGISVALPSFAGHVPVGFKRLFPNASLVQVQRWNK
jgi:alpha-N-acetylglucosaminidase